MVIKRLSANSIYMASPAKIKASTMDRHSAISVTARRIVATGVRASFFVETIKLSLYEFAVIVLPLFPLCIFSFHVLHSRNNSLLWLLYMAIYVPVMVYGLVKLFNPPISGAKDSSFWVSLIRMRNGPRIPLGYKYSLLLLFTFAAYALLLLKTHLPYRAVSGLAAASPCGKSSCTRDKLSSSIYNPNGYFPFGDFEEYEEMQTYTLCDYGKFCTFAGSNGATPPILGYEILANSGMRRNLDAGPVDKDGYATDRPEDYRNPAVGLVNGFDLNRKAEEYALCHGVDQTGTQLSGAGPARRYTTRAIAVGRQACSQCARMTADHVSPSDAVFANSHCNVPNSYPYWKCIFCPGPGGLLGRGASGESVRPEDLLIARNWSLFIMYVPALQLLALWVRGQKYEKAIALNLAYILVFTFLIDKKKSSCV